MNFKDTTETLTFEDKTECTTMKVDEVQFDDVEKDYIHLQMDNQHSVYLTLDQTRDLVEKLSKWVQSTAKTK